MQFVGGATCPGLVAEHGFAAMVTVRRGEASNTVLFDTGISPDGMTGNAQRLGIDLDSVEAVVLSHGHSITPAGWPGSCGAARCR